jgi:hypothetical protein
MFQVFYRLPSKENKPLQVVGCDYGMSIKRFICQEENIQPENQILIYHEREILDDRMLIDYKVSANDIIDVEVRDPNEFPIFVRLITGKTLIIDVKDDDLVSVMKKKVYRKIGPPNCEHRLMFHGKRLLMSQTIKECNITKDSTLFLVFEMCLG